MASKLDFGTLHVIVITHINIYSDWVYRYIMSLTTGWCSEMHALL